MPKAIQNADLTQELVREFDLRGQVKLMLDEMVVPVVISADLTKNPATEFIDAGIGHNPPAIVAQNSVAAVRAPAGADLRVDSIRIVNLQAAVRDFRVTLIAETDFPLLGGVITVGLRNFSRRQGDPPLAQSLALTAGRVGVNGAIVADATAAANGVYVFDFTGLWVRGTDYIPDLVTGTSRIHAVGVWCTTVNEAFRVSFRCTEYLATAERLP